MLELDKKTLYKLRAWLVHAYTALGGLFGVAALIFVGEGQIREAFLMLVIQNIIDSTDGILARKFNVRKYLPEFDGSMLDNVIDILTYARIPILIISSQDLIENKIFLLFPAIGAMYAYGQSNMKTEDGFFMGFPTYWNVVAMYMWWLEPSETLSSIILVVLGVLSFVPTRYLHPSKNDFMWRTFWILNAVWFITTTYLLLQEDPNRNLIIATLAYPLFYMFVSFYVDAMIRMKKKFKFQIKIL